jgi:hypothetical protein
MLATRLRRNRFGHADEPHGLIELHCRIAGHDVEMRFSIIGCSRSIDGILEQLDAQKCLAFLWPVVPGALLERSMGSLFKG